VIAHGSRVTTLARGSPTSDGDVGDAEVGDIRCPLIPPTPPDGCGETGEADDPLFSSDGGDLEGLRLLSFLVEASDLL
jgi:hypothetical protein